MTRLLLMAALVLATAGSAVATSAPPSASSGGPTFAPGVTTAAAFDGNQGTFWQGAYNSGDPSLGGLANYDVTAWQLTWGYQQPMLVTAVTVNYTLDSRFVAANAHIDCSTDGGSWTTVAPLPAGVQNPTVTFAAVCQWVRLSMGKARADASPAVSEITLAAAPAPPGPPPPPPTPLTATSLVAVGDSITAGVNSPLAWPQLLAIWRDIPDTNAGVSGNTTAMMLARFGDVLATGGQIVAVMGGSNDCQLGVPLATTMANLRAMVAQAQQASRLPLLVGPIPRNGNTEAGVPFTPCLLSLRSAIQSWAAANGVLYADPWTALEDPPGSGQLGAAYTRDTGHPNGRGQFLLARVVAHALGWQFPND